MEDMFRLDLRVRPCERIGPITNSKVVEMLNPDQHTQHPDNGREMTDYRKYTRSSWFPGLRAGENVAKKHCDEHVEFYADKTEYRASVQGAVMKRLYGDSSLNGDCPMAPDCWGAAIMPVPTPTPTNGVGNGNGNGNGNGDTTTTTTTPAL